MVSNVTDYGCFAELEQGIEGLIHLSELDWTSKNIHPSKVVSKDEKIKVMILEIDREKRRISLGLKQTKPNPWVEFDNRYNLGDNVEGEIKSITDFGIFVGLEGNIDGLIHLSDISEEDNSKEALEKKLETHASCDFRAMADALSLRNAIDPTRTSEMRQRSRSQRQRRVKDGRH